MLGTAGWFCLLMGPRGERGRVFVINGGFAPAYFKNDY